MTKLNLNQTQPVAKSTCDHAGSLFSCAVSRFVYFFINYNGNTRYCFENGHTFFVLFTTHALES